MVVAHISSHRKKTMGLNLNVSIILLHAILLATIKHCIAEAHRFYSYINRWQKPGTIAYFINTSSALCLLPSFFPQRIEREKRYLANGINLVIFQMQSTKQHSFSSRLSLNSFLSTNQAAFCLLLSSPSSLSLSLTQLTNRMKLIS